MRWRLNPKRSIVPNRVMRRAVTRGVNAYRWSQAAHKPIEQKEQDNLTEPGIIFAIIVIVGIIVLFKSLF